MTEQDLIDVDAACRLIGGTATPISASTLYRGVKDGRFPQPLHLGRKLVRWKASEIVAMLEAAASKRPGGAQ